MTDDHQFQWNRQSPVDYVPQRVISLVPSMTESLFDLDLGSRLIGVTDECTRPEDKIRALPKVGGTKNPDIARIIQMKPDLVLMNDEENRQADIEALLQQIVDRKYGQQRQHGNADRNHDAVAIIRHHIGFAEYDLA